MFAMRPLPISAAPAAYSMVAASGSYSINGAVVAFHGPPAKLAMAGGLYAYTGTAASLTKGYKLMALSGSYSITGYDMTLTRAGKWNPVIAQSETWTAKTKQAEIWTPVTEQSETWTPN